MAEFIKKKCEGSISTLTHATQDDSWPTNVERFKFHDLSVQEDRTRTSAGTHSEDEDEL